VYGVLVRTTWRISGTRITLPLVLYTSLSTYLAPCTHRTNLQRNPRRLRRVISAPDFEKYFGKAERHPKGLRRNIFGHEDELKVAPKGVAKDHKCVTLPVCVIFLVSLSIYCACVLAWFLVALLVTYLLWSLRFPGLLCAAGGPACVLGERLSASSAIWISPCVEDELTNVFFQGYRPAEVSHVCCCTQVGLFFFFFLKQSFNDNHFTIDFWTVKSSILISSRN
jgi:Conserved hypothetical protein (DUF2461)